MNLSFTCTMCWRTSHNPNDAEHGWCGNCHNYTPGVVFTDAKNMPGWRYGHMFGRNTNEVIIVRSDGRVGLTVTHIEPDCIQIWLDLLRAAQQESHRVRNNAT